MKGLDDSGGWPAPVDAWIDSLDVPPLPTDLDVSTMLRMVTERVGVPIPPPAVIKVWAYAIAAQRLIADHNEHAFITAAAGAGWSWESIGLVLGVPGTELDVRARLSNLEHSIENGGLAGGALEEP